MKNKQLCEYLRYQAKNKFNKVRSIWCELLRWGLPHRSNWILSQTPGERRNQHIVDPTHILAHRSCVAGFLEGNTSATRPWYRFGTREASNGKNDSNKAWLQHFTDRTLAVLSSSNFYYQAGNFYYDYHCVNTGAHYMEVLDDGFFVHTLMPGSYFVINDSYGNACVLIREYSLNVKAVVDNFARSNSNGMPDWSNISSGVKKMYEDGNYTQMIDIVHVIMENPDYDYKNPEVVDNRKWLELTYELGGKGGHCFAEGMEFGETYEDKTTDVFLKRFTSRRKPFIVGKSTDSFEYGEKGPMLDSLGTIKSLNKKALGKDRALEQILSPTLQGPASLRKSYVSNAPSTYIPLDGRSVSSKQKVESVFQISPAIGALIQDVGDMRQHVDRLFYADYLLYLSKNPKTRTAAETNAIVEEQNRIIGPNLQSLNTTYNVPVLEWVADYVMFEDPFLEPPPSGLEGQALKPEMISVFAQAQRAADLPAINQYMQMVAQVGQLNPKIWDKANIDKLADIYEDRLYLPAGLNNPQSKVEAMRHQAQLQMQRQQALQDTLPAVAKAAKDVSGIQQK